MSRSALTTKPYVITGIRLINFHNFIDETILIPDGGHLFLLGDNGSGKTTILDAVHYVLTFGQNMEWNAAARVAGSRREGRREQGIVMRYNMDSGALNQQGGVTYAALEIIGRHGKPMSMGIGMSTGSLDEKVLKWGVIRECPLKDIPFLIQDEQGMRPAGCLEFKEQLGSARGFYRNMSAYRDEIANRLFGGQEFYREICSFLAMGKAYREIAARTADYHELFKSLLPEPTTGIFERIIEALQSLDDAKATLEDFERKLGYLKGLQELLGQISDNREAIVRYSWLLTHLRANFAKQERDRYTHEIEQLQEQIRKNGLQMEDEALVEHHLQNSLDDLKNLDSQGLVRQEKNCREELDKKSNTLETIRKDRNDSARSLQQVERKLKQQKDGLKKAVGKSRRDLTAMAGKLSFSIVSVTNALDQAFRSDLCEQEISELDTYPAQGQAEEERDTLKEKQVILHHQSKQQKEKAASLEKEIHVLQQQSEIYPDIHGFRECYLALRNNLITAVPLYEGLEWKTGLQAKQKERIEETIGQDCLATLLVADNSYEAAREIAALFPGVRITHQGRGAEQLPLWIREAFNLEVSDPASLRCLATEMISSNEPVVSTLSGYDLLRFRSHERRLSGKPDNFIGAAGRLEAQQRLIKKRQTELEDSLKTLRSHDRENKHLQTSIALIETFRQTLHETFEQLTTLAQESMATGFQVERLLDRHTFQEEVLKKSKIEHNLLRQRLEQLGRQIQEEGLQDLDKRIKKLERKLHRQKEKREAIIHEKGRLENQVTENTRKQNEKVLYLEQELKLKQQFNKQLTALLPSVEDIDHYVLRTKKGAMFKSIEAVDKERNRNEQGVREHIATIKERLNNPEFGPAYRFYYEEEHNAILDYRSRSVDELLEHQERDIREQQEVINERTRELFKKIIMNELVGYLRSHVSDLEQMLAEIKKQLDNRSFGGQKYRFRIRPHEKYRQLVKVIKKFNPFDPASEEEIRHFFEDHKDEIINTTVGAVPEELDYRNWYRYEMEVSTIGEQGVIMDRRTKSMGSGGEQAVPNYLLILTIAHFVFHGKSARLHPMLFDEAFYGIDAGRRDQLLGFATDLGLQLFVASPDQDGVRQEIGYSTTLLVKKDTNFDVHLYPFHWKNPENTRQVSLFDKPDTPEPIVFDREL